MDSISRNSLAAGYQHAVYAVRRMFKGYDVASAYTLAEYSAISHQLVIADAQTITPSVHHQSVTFLEIRLQIVTANRIDGEGQRAECKHRNDCNAQGQDGSDELVRSQILLFNIIYKSEETTPADT